MPELPEVQTTVNGIEKNLKGLVIRDVWTDYGGTIHQHKTHIKSRKYFALFKKEVNGKKILGSGRRAKNVLIHLSGSRTILIHMKMTGHLLYGAYELTKTKKDPWKSKEKGPLRDDSFNRFVHLVFTLSNRKHLVLSDMRKFAKITLLNTENLSTTTELAHLGPEPLLNTFSAKALKERLEKKPKGKIKQVLMDQSIISGIGNIYSDEILWSSSIHPLRAVSTLSAKDIQNLWKNTKEILKKGIDFKGDSMSDYRNLDGRPGTFQNEHHAYKRVGKPCLKKGCRGIIQRMKVGGRSAHFCPNHQK